MKNEDSNLELSHQIDEFSGFPFDISKLELDEESHNVKKNNLVGKENLHESLLSPIISGLNNLHTYDNSLGYLNIEMSPLEESDRIALADSNVFTQSAKYLNEIIEKEPELSNDLEWLSDNQIENSDNS